MRRSLVCAAMVVAALSTTGAGTATSDPPGSNLCVEDTEIGDATVAWDRMRNPILSYPDAAAKDMSVRLVDGRWHILFSYIRSEADFDMGAVQSTDLLQFDPPQVVADLASPEITRAADGDYVVAAQQYDDKALAKLRHLGSPDLVDLSAAPTPLALEVAPVLDDPTQRVIDPALAHTDDGLFLAYKQGDALNQSPRIAHSPSGSIDGPWTVLGQPDVGLFENFQFLLIDGTWHLLGTTVPGADEFLARLEAVDRGEVGSGDPHPHRPVLYRMAGDPAVPDSWLRWERVREIEIPEEEWNTYTGAGDYERSNSAHLCDARALDGYFYLFYAGSTEVEAFGGRGHAKIGIARSRDLVTWEVPPDGATAEPADPGAGTQVPDEPASGARDDGDDDGDGDGVGGATAVTGALGAVIAAGALLVIWRRRRASPAPRGRDQPR